MFERGRLYSRSELHKEWNSDTRVQRQGGILTPRGQPFILLVTGEVGHDFGYTDWRDSDGVWHCYGAGQEGDMQWARGNVAIRDHVIDGKDLHLFEVNKDGLLRYQGPVRLRGDPHLKIKPWSLRRACSTRANTSSQPFIRHATILQRWVAGSHQRPSEAKPGYGSREPSDR